MKRFSCLLMFTLLISLVFVGNTSATTYYIASNGADSNNGTSKTTPWAHAPGMTGCTATCASATPLAGDQFILRGGDTWTPSSLPWNWRWSGSSGNGILLGTDKTWYTGGAWSRPIFDGVGSYPGATPGGFFLQLVNSSYVTVDNFEFKGLNWSANLCSNEDAYIEKSGGTNVTIEHVYFHGWTHSAGICEGNDANAIYAGGSDTTSIVLQIVVDGSDTARDSFGGIYGGGIGEISQSYFSYLDNGLNGSCHLIHDSVFYDVGFLSYSGAVSHNNIAESNLDLPGGCIVYNNVMQGPFSTPGGVPVMQVPRSGDTSYAFNNLMMNSGAYGGTALWCGEFFSSGNSGGTCTWFNNTLEGGPDSNPTEPLFRIGAGLSGTVPAAINEFNNHGLTSGAMNAVSPECSRACTVTQATSLLQTLSTANGQGYTLSKTFSFSPTSGGATIGVGTNESSLCTTISGINSVAGSACTQDTTYGVTYNSLSHTVSFPARTPVSRPSTGAWDVGAYQFLSGSQSTVAPPTSLSATVQ